MKIALYSLISVLIVFASVFSVFIFPLLKPGLPEELKLNGIKVTSIYFDSIDLENSLSEKEKEFVHSWLQTLNGREYRIDLVTYVPEFCLKSDDFEINIGPVRIVINVYSKGGSCQYSRKTSKRDLEVIRFLIQKFNLEQKKIDYRKHHRGRMPACNNAISVFTPSSGTRYDKSSSERERCPTAWGSQSVSHAVALGFKVAAVVGIRGGAQRKLLSNFKTVTGKADNFTRVVGEQAQLAHAEVAQNLGPHAVIA